LCDSAGALDLGPELGVDLGPARRVGARASGGQSGHQRGVVDGGRECLGLV
jgi:hypothetical protein